MEHLSLSHHPTLTTPHIYIYTLTTIYPISHTQSLILYAPHMLTHSHPHTLTPLHAHPSHTYPLILYLPTSHILSPLTHAPLTSRPSTHANSLAPYFTHTVTPSHISHTLYTIITRSHLTHTLYTIITRSHLTHTVLFSSLPLRQP